MQFLKHALVAFVPIAPLLNVPAVASAANVIYVDAAAEGANNGTSWQDAFKNLHDALAAAKDAGGHGVQIWVAAGEYLPGPADEDPQSSFHLVSGVAVYGGFAGWETELDQRGWNENETILRRDLPPPGVATRAPILVAENLSAGSVLDGFTVRDGSTWHPFGPAGLLLVQSDLAIANCVFEKNVSGDFNGGGAIFAEHSTLSIIQTTFLNNKSVEYGGAISIHNSTLDLKDSTFLGNDGGFAGGALDIGKGTVVSIDHCVFRNNKAVFDGGAIWAFPQAEIHIANSHFEGNGADGPAIIAGLITVEDSIFKGNPGALEAGGVIRRSKFIGNHSEFEGGAIWAGTIEIDDCLFEDNSSIFWGGAIELHPLGTAVIKNSRIYNNFASMGVGGGGGISSRGSLTLINCDISGNKSVPLRGDGVYQWSGDLTMINCLVSDNLGEGVRVGAWEPATATIINSTIAGNALPIYPWNGHVQVLNSIVWGTTWIGSCEGYCGGGTASCWCGELCCQFHNCCFDKFLVCGGCQPELGTLEFSHSIVNGMPPYDTGDDPLFVDPDAGDYRLQPNSPAIDAGHNAYVPDDITTDLDGNPRIAPGSEGAEPIVDIGAYEFQPPGKVGDLNGDGNVGVEDLLILLSMWGECPNCDNCPADLDGDCIVGTSDLLILLANWG